MGKCSLMIILTKMIINLPKGISLANNPSFSLEIPRNSNISSSFLFLILSIIKLTKVVKELDKEYFLLMTLFDINKL